MIKLPVEFERRMIQLLGEEYPKFIESFSDPRHYGLRINTLKWSVEEALHHLPFELSAIDWVKEGFYYSENERPAKHPYYQAGLYYIQEPSAMAPGATIPIMPGDRVLDLCAAPGGKSTQVAARLQGKGVLVSNDISNERIKALVKNIELFGVKNAIVTNETPDKLATVFEQYFDKILIDAPCSGEGMFRKNPEMIKSWEQHNVDSCVVMQKDILEEAAKMLRDGGYILYSTCTFAPEENEKQMARFLATHPEFQLCPIDEVSGYQRGNRLWGETEDLPWSILSVFGPIT
ncbi:RsmB/NOP family class I SAM-dependent RNA methyltransferase [Caldalkalibacillus mannanilyticus]|uniref:RsmB/NOP family class I SAM-dependent RNA methyltransferase n=1 Tax=Caldalkalibacillus mannanilyticus TaxID=1418 RepID=UPI000AD1D735|nr:RsmB/NOP family class I SAM-dependent RNA methyltransferase [Caldalkalibacillus mannanilyticus]